MQPSVRNRTLRISAISPWRQRHPLVIDHDQDAVTPDNLSAITLFQKLQRSGVSASCGKSAG
jgi:hypothetical protein